MIQPASPCSERTNRSGMKQLPSLPSASASPGGMLHQGSNWNDIDEILSRAFTEVSKSPTLQPGRCTLAFVCQSFRCKSLLHCKLLLPHLSSSTNWFCWIWVPVIDQPDNAHNTPWPLKKCGHAGTLVLRILYNMYVAISMCNASLDQKLCLHLTCQYITASFPLRYAPAICMRV